MDRGTRASFKWLLAGCLLGSPAILRAQNEAEPADPAAQAEADVSAPLPVDPSRSPLAVEPKTPEELFEATIQMVDIARLDLAGVYLRKLLAESLEDDLLLALREKFGAAAFLKLARIDSLNPGASRLLDLLNATTLKQISDPAYLQKLIASLGGDPEARAAAEAELTSLGAPAVPGLLEVLADSNRAAEHESIIEVILAMQARAVPPLLGALTGPAEKTALQSQAMALLGQLEARAAVPYLWYPAQAAEGPADVRLAARTALAQILNLSPEGVERVVTDGAVRHLLETAREHFRHKHAWIQDEAGKVSLWWWDARRNTVALRSLTPAEASDMVGLRQAREALSLAPQQKTTQTLYLAFLLATDVRRAGFDRPLPEGPGTAHDTALGAGSELALDVIGESLQAQRADAAAAALKVFSQIGTLAQLQLGGPQKSSVVAALDFPDPRVQFAAATTILQIDPATPFRGATRVVEILRRALVTDGRAHAVVAEVSADRGAMIGGILRELGYESLVVLSGREAFAAAAARPDVELVVVHPNVIRWPLTETLGNLRADSRTASIPIIIHGPSSLTPQMERKSQNFRLVAFSAAAETTSDFDRQLTPLLRQIKAVSMNAQERRAQRVAAAAWLAHIAQGRRTKIFEIRSAEPEVVNLLNDNELAEYGLEILAEISTGSSQQRLASVVLDVQAPLDLRRSAAQKLAFHIQRFGLLLARSDVDGLHKLWESDSEPAELRTSVGSVIGSLKPDGTLSGKRLQQQAPRPR